MTAYAVGDIQGCFQSLQALLAEADFSPSRDSLWVAGDLVNRGPESLQTLRFLHALGDAAIIVLGNHDLHLLALANSTRSAGKSDTLDQVLAAPDWPQLEHWLRQQPLLHVDHNLNIALVHAGIAPQWPIEQALALAGEVEAAIQGDDYRDYFAAMYGNQPDCWSEQLIDIERLRCITNYLTRMRFCNQAGQLDLQDKSHRHSTRPGFKAWFDYHAQQQPDGPEIIFGHWAALNGETNQKRYFGIDTGCVWGGDLTLMNIKNKNKISVKNDNN
ncbi:Bis(5'-nucleosyl)-tetraphosphatase, symmetrical [Sinobacterium norvegicum]|uniref:bis(5'-nucleosyl)-tetraphosphatase (symmetrical) n=1 Tax=Sinobacterium norvegicum TaxID=1641715 RepID=A0ABM9AE37_9GAMM|nr:symmetrical bis(5'-nucleosyl)-tetraphosphatase [Sinobacterium norvegicum]CAH0991482.1 Bis(5'-nucleosyl)-tetraphosphatase, symmetrical [Sinobacterium norvegicum]